MPLAGPFNEFKLTDQYRLDPPTIGHLSSCQASAPTSGFLLRQVDKRASFHFQSTETLHQRFPDLGGEAIARPGRVQQLDLLVIAEDESVERGSPDCVAANDKLLTLVDTHLH